jgi:hypothetical protein
VERHPRWEGTVMHRIRLAVTAAALGIAAPLLATAPASATPPFFEESTNTFTDHLTDFCDVPGLTVDNAVVVQSRLKIQTRKNGLDYFLEHLVVDETLTGPSGESVTVHSTFITMDLKVTDNGDGTLTIVSLSTGMSTLYDPGGKAIARDPGQSRFLVLIDTNETPSDPTDDVELSSELIKGSTGRSDDYCEAWLPILS